LIIVTHDSALARSVDQVLELREGRLKEPATAVSEFRGADGRLSRV
jgi:ABC-type lipoprotein export system ATPase subunit